MSAVARGPETDGVEFPRNEIGLGALIREPGDPGLIDGVVVEAGRVYPDDRGFFMEVMRMGQGPAAHFPAESTQISMALSYPGTIKAFHIHRNQTDLWAPAQGMLQVALCDLRPGSPTFGLRNTLYCGKLRPWQILIPPGVAHGYKIIGEEAAVLVYVTNRFYDPQDEGRIAYDHPGIAYDWETQHK